MHKIMAATGRIEEIRAKAYRLARGGAHQDWPSVRDALLQEGCQEARFALDDPIVAAHIRGLCRKHGPAEGR
jgi:hypothetical protein